MFKFVRLSLLAAVATAFFAFAGAASAAPTFTLTEPVDGQHISGQVSINGYAPAGTTLTAATCAISNTSYSTPWDCLYMTRWVSVGHVVNGGEGNKVITVKVTDATGTTTITRTVYNDLTAPDTFINSGPTGTITGTNASFAFTASETASFQCNLDNAGWNACSSPYEWTGLADGSHTFAVRAIDLANLTDASPAVRSFSVNNAPPIASISDISTPTNDSTPTWNINVDRPDGLAECRIDGGSWSACDGSYTADTLSDGSHTLEARAFLVGPTDIQTTPDSQTFEVDTIAPEAHFTNDIANFAGLDAAFAFSTTSSDVDYYNCLIDGNFFPACNTPFPWSYSDMTDDWKGDHFFQVWAIDFAGNEGDVATRVFHMFKNPPETLILSKPDSSVATQTATFKFSSDTATAFECAIDGGAFSSCPSEFSVSGLSAGVHALQVRAKDPAGQVDPSPDSAVFTLLPPPVTDVPAPIVSKPAAKGKSLTVTVSGAGSISVKVETCKKKSGKTKCRKYTTGTATATASGKLVVRLKKALKKKSKYRLTIKSTSSTGQTSTLVKSIKTK